jgi:polysaccharide export outer membrane protein
MSMRPIHSLVILLGAALLVACAKPAAPPPPEPDMMAREVYTIGNADVLRIAVWKNPELSVEVPVRPDGKISVPLLNDVQAAGLTPEELKELLTKQLAEYVANPDVTVVVISVLSKRVYVLGAVIRSGPIPLTTDMRVLDAISVAGGFAPFAKKSGIRILRRSEGEIVEYRLDYGAYLDGDLPPHANMLLHPGDTIVVPD